MSLLAELRRRKVFKVGAAYLVVAWLAVQAASIAFPTFEAPLWALRVFILVVLLGLPLALVLAWVFEVTPEGTRLDASVSGSKRVFAGAAVLVVLALAWYVRGQPAFKPPTPDAAGRIASAPPARATRAAEATSIAVLPFVDMSQGHDQEYFSDGLSEELLNLLAQLPQLRVIARTSSFSFKGKEVDVPTIAHRLGVAHVLEGSVRKSGNTLRITAQLIRASDGSHLWSQTYDRELTDVFKVQDEIAGAVVDALKLKLLPAQAMSNLRRSDHPEAYNQFLLGNEFIKRGTVEDWRHAADAYRRAVELDPNFAAAWAGLADSTGNLADLSGADADKVEAIGYAERAVALAPDLVDGYIWRGTNRLSFRNDWVGARADFEKALALAPGDAQVQIGAGRMMIALGRIHEATAASRRATELDPLSADAFDQLGRLYYAAGDYPAARAALDRALQASPGQPRARFHRGVTALLDGHADEALRFFQGTGNGYGEVGIAMAEHSLGHARESQAALEEAIARYAQGAAYQIAEAYAWRGEKDKAFEWLERARVQRDGGLTFIRTDPLVASLVGDPRYVALMQALGMPR